ncbi:MAG: glucose-1-phosphate adenylyltransferase subunit GlgD, partial [Oscillospiraceae bacterium]
MSGKVNVLGMIFANMHDNSVLDLTKSRTMGSVLFGGRYRLIDFPLSNMVNSGITEVGVITKSNYQSLLDHLGSGREWDLARKKGGLHLLPPFGHVGSGMYRGRIEALYGVWEFIENSDADYVVLSDCDVVTTIDYDAIVEKHIETMADITVVYGRTMMTMEQSKSSTIIAANEEGRIFDILINPQISGSCDVSLNMYVMGKEFLKNCVLEAISRSLYSFEKDILQAHIREYKIMGYKHDGYFSKIDSTYNYYKANMALLDGDIRKKLFFEKSPIYTKVRDNAPVKFGLDAMVKNSLVADGCIINGKVENSILFRGVKVAKGACIKNAILMQDTDIGQKCEVNYVITDKQVSIGNY